MDDYKKLIDNLRSNQNNIFQLEAADAIEQLVKERDAAVADFNQFAIYGASKESFACEWRKSQRSDGRCQWFIDHKDDKTCRGVHFEWRGVQENNDERTE